MVQPEEQTEMGKFVTVKPKVQIKTGKFVKVISL